MPGLNVAFYTGTTSLLTRQRQMAVVGQNLANAGRTDYHRQVATPQTNVPLTEAGGQYGTGIHVDRVLRIYDAALEGNLREAIYQDGYHQALAAQLELLEGVLAPDGASAVQDALAGFADAWQDLSQDPASTAQRALTVEQGRLLAGQVNQARADAAALAAALTGPNGRLAAQVEETNRIAAQIAQLNQQIAQYERRNWQPQQANDLRDRRDALVQELAAITEVSVRAEPDHTYTVQIAGRDVVAGDRVLAALAVSPGPPAGVAWADDGAPVEAGAGSLQGLVDAASRIGDAVNGLDAFAASLADVLNTAHAAGFDAYGAAGTALFDAAQPGALRFAVDDPAALAASSQPGEAGNSANAQAVWDAMHAGLPALDGRTLLEYPDRMIDRVASDAASARALADGSAAGVSMFRGAVQDLSGVNADQELLSMLEIQRAFQASARFVNVVDDMIGDVINLL